jgi:hypothetical protein
MPMKLLRASRVALEIFARMSDPTGFWSYSSLNEKHSRGRPGQLRVLLAEAGGGYLYGAAGPWRRWSWQGNLGFRLCLMSIDTSPAG